MKLWLIVLFVLVPVSMIVSEVSAENDYKKPPVISLKLSIPHEISVKYLWKNNPEDCLVPLEIIPVIDCGGRSGVVPFVTVAQKKEIMRTGIKPEDIVITVEAIICLCNNPNAHKHTCIQLMNALDDRGVMQPIWYNPELLSREKKKVEPPPLPSYIS